MRKPSIAVVAGVAILLALASTVMAAPLEGGRQPGQSAFIYPATFCWGSTAYITGAVVVGSGLVGSSSYGVNATSNGIFITPPKLEGITSNVTSLYYAFGVSRPARVHYIIQVLSGGIKKEVSRTFYCK